MTADWNALLAALPQSPEEPIRWDAITATGYGRNTFEGADFIISELFVCNAVC